jgi:TPR repeat protein
MARPDSATPLPHAAPQPAAGPRVTVGVPAYNNAATIVRSVRSVQAQTVRDWQMVISDDNSSDGTVEICERLAAQDARIRVVRQPTNLLHMNFGFLLGGVETPFFAWLAGDDYWHPTFLECCLERLEPSPEAVSAVPRTEFADARRLVERAADTSKLDGSPAERAYGFLSAPNGSRMYGLYRTDVLRRAFPPRNMYAYDFALTLAALREGPQLGVEQTLLVRSPTPWQEYSWSVRRLYDRRLLRAFPLLDVTLYMLRRGLAPLRPKILGRLVVLNAQLHESYVYVNRPALFLRLWPIYRRLGLPLSCREQAALALARDHLDSDDGALRAAARRHLERRAAAGVGLADMMLASDWKERGPFPVGHGEAARHYARAARSGVEEAGFDLLVTEFEAGERQAAAHAQAMLGATRAGSARAAVELARLVVSGLPAGLDPTAIHSALERRRGEGHPVVLHALASLAERGIGRPRDRSEALSLLVAASARDPRIARDVARLLREHSPDGPAEAELWLWRAAEAGDGTSLRDLAEIALGRNQFGEALHLAMRSAAASRSPELAQSLGKLMARIRAAWDAAEERTPRPPAAAQSKPLPAEPRETAPAMVTGDPSRPTGGQNVVIWGVHRSGTSVVAECFERLGWHLGDANRGRTVESPHGFFEHRLLTDLNDQLLAAAGASWSNWGVNYPALRFDEPRFRPFRRSAEALLDSLDSASGDAPWAIKDPRMCATAGFWVPLIARREPPTGHLLVIRNPQEVASSQLARAIGAPEAHRMIQRPEAMLVLWASNLAATLKALGPHEVFVVSHADVAKRGAAALGGFSPPVGAPSAEPASAGPFEPRYHRERGGEARWEGPWADLADRLYERLEGRAGARFHPRDDADLTSLCEEIERMLDWLRPVATLLASAERGDPDWFGFRDG